MGMSFDEFLEHYGVKGMKWGVRKEYEPVGGDSAKKTTSKSQFKTVELSETEKAVVDKLSPHGYDIDRMDRMYGPKSKGEGDDKGFRLTPAQKKALMAGGAAVLAGAALYGLNRYGNKVLADLDPLNSFPGANEHFRSVLNSYNETVIKRRFGGLSKEYVDSLDTTPFTLKPGGILKRLSTERETMVKSGGFFAVFKDSDVERYKAILPVYWKQWGIDQPDGGFIVNLRANQEIRAPSKRETFDMFVEMLKDPDKPGSTMTIGEALKAYYGRPDADDETLARHIFPEAAGQWINEGIPLTKQFFDKLRSKGYNAVFDLNDAGALGDSPLRVLDGSLFSVAGHDRLSNEAIKTAQEQILELVHAIFGGKVPGFTLDTDAFLAHYGVRGMKWGVRRGRKEKSTDRTRYSKPPAKLTDAELKRRLQRLENEKRYNELNKGDISAGRDFTAKILKTAGSTAATTLLTAAAVYGGKMVIGNVLGIETMNDMFPKKKK